MLIHRSTLIVGTVLLVLGQVCGCSSDNFLPDETSLTLGVIASNKSEKFNSANTNLQDENTFKIVFSSDHEGDGRSRIYVVNYDGTELAQLTDGYSDIQPMFSPDGSMIAYVSAKSDDEQSENDLYVMNVDGSGRTKLVDNFWATALKIFSPNSSKIVFVQANSLYVINIDGTGKTLLADGSVRENILFSPDSSLIAFVDSEYGLNIVRADGTDRKKLADNISGFSFSPGSRIVTSIDGVIFVMNTDGSEKKQLTHRNNDDYWPVFSPDGSKISFTSSEGSARTLLVMNSDGSDVKQLADDISNSSLLEFSPDGKKIAYNNISITAGAQSHGLKIINADGSGTVQLTDGINHSVFKSFSPDSSLAVFLTLLEADASSNRVWYLNVASEEGTDVIVLEDSRFLVDNDISFAALPVTPVYPHLEPITRIRRVFSATAVPQTSLINGKKYHLPIVKFEKVILVLVVGHDLFGDPWQFQAESRSEGVRVSPVRLMDSSDLGENLNNPFGLDYTSLTESWPKESQDWLKSMGATYLWFHIDDGVLPGNKRFVINGIEADWFMKTGTILAHMSVARSDWRGSLQDTDVAYHHDEIEVVVKTTAPIDLKELKVQVLVDGKKSELVGMESLVLKGNSKRDTFSSGPIRVSTDIANATAMRAPTIVAPEHSQITLVTDSYNQFENQTSTSVLVSVTPARMPADYPLIKEKSGITISYLWKDALLLAATIAGKKVDDWGELSQNEADEITNFIVSEFGDREVKVTIGHHAGMILMRKLFIQQMSHYLATLPEKPDREFLRIWYKLVSQHRYDGNFGPGRIEVTGGFERGLLKYGDVPSMLDRTSPRYGSKDDGRLLRLRGHEIVYVIDGQPYSVLDNINRNAYLGWREAVVESLKTALATDVDKVEDMLELTGPGFGPIVKMLLPRLVKLEERGTPRQLVWVPDEQAQLTVRSIESVANEAFAIKEVGKADTSLIVSLASLGLLAPVTIPSRIMLVAIETGMAVEAGIHAYDYYKSMEAVDFALGSMQVLGSNRLSVAKSRAISGWGVALGIIGSVVGLGSETYGLVAAVRTSRSIERALELLPELEKGGLEVLQAMSKEDQVSVLTAVTASKSNEQGLLSSFGPNKQRFSDYGTNLQLEADSWMEAAGVINFRTRGTALDFDETLVPGNTRIPREGNPPVGSTFKIMGDSGPEDVVLEKFLGQGAFCDVYSIKGDPTRVVKIAHDIKSASGAIVHEGKNTVLNAQRVQQLLDDKDIFQLRIRQFAPDAPRPYMIQNAIKPGEHHIFNWMKREQTKLVNGIEFQVNVRAGIKSDITPDGTLPREAQRAVLDLFKKLSDGPNPLVWEDGHILNVFLVKDGDGFRAGILDQDRIALFSDISKDQGMYNNMIVKYERNVVGHKVESLRNRIKPKNSMSILLDKGTLSPSADFFMAKMLEYGGRYIKYNRKTGEFEKVLFDIDIVEEFFPKLKEWVDPDLSSLGGGDLLLAFPRYVEDLSSLTISVFSEHRFWQPALAAA